MKISIIKYKGEETKHRISKLFGIDTSEIEVPDNIDNKIEELRKEDYDTFIISNELASFSEKIINKYKYDNKINIIITPNRNKT